MPSLNPAIICQAQQYRVQMTVVPALKECNHFFCKSTSISRNLGVGHGQFWVKRNYPCSSAEPCASAASCMTGQWEEVQMEGWWPLSSIFPLTASSFQRGQSLWFLDRDDLVHVCHLMSHLSPAASYFSHFFANIRRHKTTVYL